MSLCGSLQFKVYLLFCLVSVLGLRLSVALLRAIFRLRSEGRRRRSLELNHVEVVEWHEVTVAAEDVHEAFGVLDCAVAVASGGLSSLDEAKFTLMCVLCGFVPVCVVKAACSLSLLVVDVKALVGVLDDEGVTHRNRGG